MLTPTIIALALVLATLRTIERGLDRTALTIRIAQATLLPHNYANGAFLMRLDARPYQRAPRDIEQVRYPGAWGDMAQTIFDDTHF